MYTPGGADGPDGPVDTGQKSMENEIRSLMHYFERGTLSRFINYLYDYKNVIYVQGRSLWY